MSCLVVESVQAGHWPALKTRCRAPTKATIGKASVRNRALLPPVGTQFFDGIFDGASNFFAPHHGDGYSAAPSACAPRRVPRESMSPGPAAGLWMKPLILLAVPRGLEPTTFGFEERGRREVVVGSACDRRGGDQHVAIDQEAAAAQGASPMCRHGVPSLFCGGSISVHVSATGS